MGQDNDAWGMNNGIGKKSLAEKKGCRIGENWGWRKNLGCENRVN